MTACRQIPLSEAAHRLGLSWAQAWRLVLCQTVDGKKVGGRWVVSEADVDRLLAERGAQTAA